MTLRRLLARLARGVVAQWRAVWRSRPIEEFVVLYESFGGNGANCNPEAIYRALLVAPDQLHLEHVWALDRHAMRTIGRELRREPRTRIVRRSSAAYARVLATAGTLINNATFPPEFARRDGQRYLNTWHGTPLKRMGFDEPDGAAVSANVLRNFLNATHLLSQNRYMTEQMYRGAYRLDGVFTGVVLEVGYPRNDRLNADVTRLRARLRAAGVHLGDERIVLYAPTWRGERFSRPEDRSAEMADVVESLQRQLDDAGVRATVLVKAHQAVVASAREEPRLRHRLVPNELPTNVVLGGSDVLVSDYSSIVVDWLATGRPVVLAADADGVADAYEATRGLYVTDAWPGPRCTDREALGAAVTEALVSGIPAGYRDAYRAMRDRFVADDDGHAADRVVDVLFRRVDVGDRAITLPSDGRTSMLVHLGGMRSNGITSAAVNLLPRLVDAGLDVTVTFPNSNRAANRLNRMRIDPRVRQLQRIGGMNGSKWLHVQRRRAERRGYVYAHERVPALRRLWDDEWRRCFGQARFDAVVDFSAYAPFWAELLLHAPEPTVRSVWLHNDMAAEVTRHVDGRARMRRSLSMMIGLYPQFDRAVSVSPSLARHNEARLTKIAPATYVSARNVIDDAAVRRMSLEDPVWPDGAAPDHAGAWFVCVGRLSPEKNHGRLLRAFRAVHADHPDARLLVVGGGDLDEPLRRLAERLGIGSAVVFTGAVDNPFAIMAAADCLVVSSDYEGQPMVVLEAAVLGMPIVATDFESVRDVLPGDQVHVVASTDAALADGMRDFLAGRVPGTTFDAARYNEDVTAEFLRATLPARTPASGARSTIGA